MLGALLAFLSACFQGTNNAAIRRGVLTGTPSQAIAINLPLGIPLGLLAAWASGELFRFDELPTQSILLIGMAGIMQYLWGRYWNYLATQKLGSVSSGPLMQMQMWIAVALAMIFLGETMSLMKLTGILLIFCGPLLVAYAIHQRNQHNRSIMAANAKAGPGEQTRQLLFQPTFWAGVGAAILACLGFGTAPVVIRYSIEGTGMGIAAGLIAYTAATVTFALVTLVIPGLIRHILAMNRSSMKWYSLSGLLVYAAQTLFFVALTVAPVTVVSPIHQFALVARVVAGYFINRDHELLTPPVILAVFISFAGTVILAIEFAGA